MLDKIFVHNWMALPATTRARLRELLHISKTGQTEVRSEGGGASVLVSDGVSAKDLEVITVKLLQDFLGSEETEFPRLWALAVMKADKSLSDIGAGDAPKEVKEEKVEKPVSTGDSDSAVKTVENEKSDKKECPAN